ncbi:hypothetical protein ABZ712_12260 [Streptomyces sp. NPDC006906]|uniref:hypothetical protein n=1 Tax=Streptomyces sp. NPDC006906 TaxID=3154782 RepID=UPI0033DB0443
MHPIDTRFDLPENTIEDLIRTFRSPLHVHSFSSRSDTAGQQHPDEQYLNFP